MTTILNIGELVGIVPEGVLRKQGAEMSETGSIRDAWLRIADDGTILDFGSMSHYRPAADPADRLWPLRTGGAQGPQPDDNGAMVIDAEGGLLMPGFCDSHTHIVYAGSREGEFLDKIKGLSYEEIAARGGGILNSSDLLGATPEDELYRQSLVRVREMMAFGSTSIEIKSGYGLSEDGEMKMLRVIKRLREDCGALIRSTFLGAHAVARGLSREQYVEKVIHPRRHGPHPGSGSALRPASENPRQRAWSQRRSAGGSGARSPFRRPPGANDRC